MSSNVFHFFRSHRMELHLPQDHHHDHNTLTLSYVADIRSTRQGILSGRLKRI